MIYALLFIVYAQQGVDVKVQSVETRAMFSTEEACKAVATTKVAAFAMIQAGAQPAWRDAQCVAVPTTWNNVKIADGFDGL